MIKPIKYFFEALVIYFFFIIIKITGLAFNRNFFSMIFKKIGPFIKSRHIIESNLKKFDKDLTIEKKEKIIEDMWSNYGKTFVEYMFLKKFRQTNEHIQIDGQEILDDVFNRNKPVIFISGHFANFELMSMEITKKNIPLATIYRPLNNFFLNPFMEYLRKTYICKNQIKKGRRGVREAIEFIKNECSIALMVDQRVSEGEKINFFNEKCFTTTLPAQLAFKFGLDIVPIFIQRTNKDFFIIEVHQPIDIKKYENKNELSLKLNNEIEKMIAKNPSQWIWTHNRWK